MIARFRTLNETQVQLMEITLNNFAPSTADPSSWITKPTTFTLSSSSIRTVLPGTVQRLRGGDQVRVIVGVLNTNNVTAGTQVDDVVVLVDGKQVGRKWSVTAGIPDYVEGDESLMTHESPGWFDGAKVSSCYIPHERLRLTALLSSSASSSTGVKFPAFSVHSFSSSLLTTSCGDVIRYLLGPIVDRLRHAIRRVVLVLATQPG